MGLYGALVIRPAGHPNWAYNDSSTQFDPSREYLILLSDFDPDLHHAVEVGTNYDLNDVVSRYFTVNGRSFPDTIQDNGYDLLPNQPYGAMVRIQPYGPSNQLAVLIRMANVGILNHPFHPHGDHLTQIAQDGRLLLNPGGGPAFSERFGETIGSGQTEDYLFKWTDQDFWDPNINPFPVTQPNYLNLTFKGGDTYYSGSPYLGYKGTLPTGTTSLNLCGEWYFPFHSHALNEFANYDAGFGGMGTLLRVDPLGGCFVFPSSTKILAGKLNSGTVANLNVDDAKYYKVTSTTTGTRTTDWYAQFSGVPATSLNLAVTYKGNNSVNSASQTIYIWNWITSSWVQINGPTPVGTTDVQVVIPPVPAAPVAGSWASYIGTGSNRGLVRVRVLSTLGSNFVTGSNLVKLIYDAP